MRTRDRSLTIPLSLLALGAVTTGGCLARPVETLDPTTKVSFVTSVKKSSVDKIDLLLMIDNSASMGDKQAILADAVPDLVNRLVTPNCVDANGEPNGEKANPNRDVGKECSKGKPEFKPVTDIHVAVVSSSMGGFGSDACGKVDGKHNDDKAHLLNRPGVPAEDSNFLAWYPDTEANAAKVPPFGYSHVDLERYTEASAPSFSEAFAKVVSSVGQDGCGFEAQLESFYRFLIQPDPYAEVKLPSAACLGSDSLAANACKATLEGYDDTVLKQRADFLRPDSLVAVILLTDEDDSSVDPLSINGAGWGFMNSRFPGSNQLRDNDKRSGTTAPRSTSACDKDPASPECTSCAISDSTGAIASDSKCKESKFYGPADDSMNVRFFRMKERFGVDPQFPIKRYVDGLLNTRVPDRNNEHDEYGNYVGTKVCVNPLYALSLPQDSSGAANGDLCNLTLSSRSSDSVFFAVIGGVPHQIVSENTDKDGQLSEDGWTKVLGKDPASFNYDGIDPHMIQSITPRATLEGPAAVGSNGSDPFHGREWDTGGKDLQYACTFALAQEKPCDKEGTGCSISNDCDGIKATPLCKSDDSKVQVRAKAYPTIREFQVVRELKSQGIIASLCPENPLTKTLSDGKDDPTYGYRPAVKAIVDRLKDALANTCVPQALARDEKSGEVPCLLLETLPTADDTCAKYKLKDPDPTVLKAFLDSRKQNAEEGDTTATSTLPVCEIPQIVKDSPSESCEADADAGWCYVTDFGKCKQSVLLTASAQVPGSQTYLQCINQFSASSNDSATVKAVTK